MHCVPVFSVCHWLRLRLQVFTKSFRYKFGEKKASFLKNFKIEKMPFLQKVQFWQFFILLQEGCNAQQRAYLYQTTLN